MFQLITTLLLAATCLLHTEGLLIESTETVLTCGDPNNVHHLRCDSGVISMVSALYGRHDSTTCPTGKASDTRCSQEGSVKVLQERCDGKKVCDVKIKSIQDPDPCPGTDKYLKTTNNCLPAFYSEAKIQCAYDEKVIIYDANYGRTDLTTCTPHGWFSHFNEDDCVSPGATSTVAARCTDKSICFIPAKNTEFGDPCPGIVKFLDVGFTCQQSVYQCENRRIRLSCFGGKVVSVYSSFYGRLNKEKCGYTYGEAYLRDTNCSVQTPTIFTMCDGKPFCDIEVNSSEFGDPCPGSHKYLDLVYGCVPKPQRSTEITV